MSTPYRYTVSFDADLANCADDEVIRIGLQNFTAPLQWSWLTPDASAFVVHHAGIDYQVAVTPGNPTCRRLASLVTVGFWAAKGEPVDTTRFRCGFDAVTGKLTFSGGGAAVGLTFPSDAAARVYGFDSAVTAVRSLLVADAPLNPQRYASLCLTLEGVTPRACFNASNQAGGAAQPTTMFASIPVPADAVPFAPLVWTNDAKSFAMFISDRRLNTLTFSFTDVDGRPVLDLPDHQLTLAVDVYTVTNPSHDTLRGMHETLSDMLQYWALN